MTIPEMHGQSPTLIIFGMGVVIVFLVILIIRMKFEESHLGVSGTDKEDKSVSFGAPVQVVHTDDRSIVAAIAAALKQKN